MIIKAFTQFRHQLQLLFLRKIVPTVSLTSPVANQTYSALANIKLSANATDQDGSISKVEFYNGNTLITTEKNLPYSWIWKKVPAGTYKITAKAYDNTCSYTFSSPIAVTVQNSLLIANNAASPIEQQATDSLKLLNIKIAPIPLLIMYLFLQAVFKKTVS